MTATTCYCCYHLLLLPQVTATICYCRPGCFRVLSEREEGWGRRGHAYAIYIVSSLCTRGGLGVVSGWVSRWSGAGDSASPCWYDVISLWVSPSLPPPPPAMGHAPQLSSRQRHGGPWLKPGPGLECHSCREEAWKSSVEAVCTSAPWTLHPWSLHPWTLHPWTLHP